ncbi:DUF397 domain-containing protein [Streptosporangium sp. NPDC001681]
MAVRDSKNPHGPALVFSPWTIRRAARHTTSGPGHAQA